MTTGHALYTLPVAPCLIELIVREAGQIVPFDSGTDAACQFVQESWRTTLVVNKELGDVYQLGTAVTEWAGDGFANTGHSGASQVAYLRIEVTADKSHCQDRGWRKVLVNVVEQLCWQMLEIGR